MTTILVTGANGFIGRALCAELARREYCVLGVVRDLSRSLNLPCKMTEIGDIEPAMDWSATLKGVKVVVHLVARVHKMCQSVPDPLKEFRRINVASTENLARQAVLAGVRRFIYLSSIKVNGEETFPGRPFTEQDLSAPVDPYSISKYEAEDRLRQVAGETAMEVVIIRPSLVYGPGVKANFLSLMRCVNKRIPLPLGAIQNKRSFVALDNLVDLIIICITHPAAGNQTFLASDGEDLSTPELLCRMGMALGTPARLFSIPMGLLQIGALFLGKRAAAQRLCGSLQVDISKARTLLDWTPPVSVDDALRKTAHYFLGTSPQ